MRGDEGYRGSGARSDASHLALDEAPRGGANRADVRRRAGLCRDAEGLVALVELERAIERRLEVVVRVAGPHDRRDRVVEPGSRLEEDLGAALALRLDVGRDRLVCGRGEHEVSFRQLRALGQIDRTDAHETMLSVIEWYMNVGMRTTPSVCAAGEIELLTGLPSRPSAVYLAAVDMLSVSRP